MSPILPFRTLGSALLLGSLLAVSPLDAQTPSTRRTPPLSYAAPAKVGVSHARLARIDAL